MLRITSQTIASVRYTGTGGVMPSLVEQAIFRINTLSDDGLRSTYLDALRMSYIWEGITDDRQPVSAESIVAATQLAPHVLDDNLILLSKKRLVDYAADLHISRSIQSINKSLTGTTYVALFKDGRNPVRNGKRLLIAYAEARRYFGIHNRGYWPRRSFVHTAES